MRLLWSTELVHDGLRNLLRHKLRSTLTLLGVVFGVAAVITMLGIGEGAQRTVLRQISALGLRNIIVDSVQPPAGGAPRTTSRRGLGVLAYGLTHRDQEQIQAVCPDAEVVSARLIRHGVYSGGSRLEAQTLGVPAAYFELFDTRVVRGRLLTSVDDMQVRQAAVINVPLAAALDAASASLCPTLRIGGTYFDIVGVADVPARESRNSVFVPYRTARQLFGTMQVKADPGSVEAVQVEIGRLVVHTRDESRVEETARLVRRTLEANHREPDFSVEVPLDLLRQKQRTQHILNAVLVCIAAISLLVGGIGIMNIMLAIVTERVPEIGLRRAVGAKRSDILLQFLAETLTLASLGGIAGCLLGLVAVPLASRWTGWPGIVTPLSVFVSLAVSWVVGLVFGIAPAIRAAQLDPVVALRRE